MADTAQTRRRKGAARTALLMPLLRASDANQARAISPLSPAFPCISIPLMTAPSRDRKQAPPGTKQECQPAGRVLRAPAPSPSGYTNISIRTRAALAVPWHSSLPSPSTLDRLHLDRPRAATAFVLTLQRPTRGPYHRLSALRQCLKECLLIMA